MTTTDDLHARLVAAVTARRELAQAATPGPWTATSADRYYGHRSYVWEITDSAGREVVGHQPHEGGGINVEEDANHIAFNDPAQILRDTEAHLKILDLHPAAVGADDGSWLPATWDEPDAECRTCHLRPCPTRVALAGIYLEVTEQ